MNITTRVRQIVGISIAAALLVFIALNFSSITVNILVAKIQMPLGFVVIFSALAGAGVMWLLYFMRGKKKKKVEEES